MVYSLPAIAAEIDSFSMRYALTQDVTVEVNAIINQQIAAAIDSANQALHKRNKRRQSFNLPAVTCDPNLLYKYLTRRLVGAPINPIETYIHEHPHLIAQSQRDRAKTIYSDLTFYETPALGLSPKIGATLKMGDFIIGTDKLGHFLTEGWVYFKHVHLNASLPNPHEVDDEETDPFTEPESHPSTLQALTWIIEHGDWLEKYPYGALTTGIYSYADLTANLNGMHFWHQLLASDISKLPTMPTTGPYVQCQEYDWVQIKPFDWSAYIDAAWDEGINCNRYRNARIEAKIENKISQLEAVTGQWLSCPIITPDLTTLKQKYGPFYYWVINLAGSQPLKPDADAINSGNNSKGCPVLHQHYKIPYPHSCSRPITG